MSINLNRRRFLIAAAAVGAGAVVISRTGFLQKPVNRTHGILLGANRVSDGGKIVTSLSVLDLDASSPRPRYLPLPFFGHGLAIDPLNHNRMCLFEKKGPGACEIDLSVGKMTRTISTLPTRHFYGHGSYSSDGSVVYCTETDLESSQGYVVVRNSKTLQVEGEFPSYGANPHDCQLIEGGKVIAITNGGAAIGHEPAPNVAYVDIVTQKLLQKFELDNSHFNTGHLAISKSGDLAVTSAPRLGLPESDLGALSFLRLGRLETMKAPAEVVAGLRAETLSLCINEATGIVAATSPAGNLLTFWELKSGRLAKSVEINNPRGIAMTLDKTQFILSHGQEGVVSLFNAATLDVSNKLEFERVGFSGSHLFIWGEQSKT
jgi:hypothetical protein